MITHLKGVVEKISQNVVILDVNGVGYSVICSTRTINELQRETPVQLFTVMNIREDAWTLYGFFSEEERFWFNKFTGVQGVGGKVGIAILSALSNDDIYNAFLSGDINILTRADGVGAKLATRIITELKDKIVGKIDINLQTSTSKTPYSNTVNDVISALSNLGYQKSEISRVISSFLCENEDNFDELLKKVLKNI